MIQGEWSGNFDICANYDPAAVPDPSVLQLLHFDTGMWIDITTNNDEVNGMICGQTDHFSPFALVSAPVGTSTPKPPIAPERLEIKAAIPNPFNPQTEIHFANPEHALVEVAVYGVAGRRIRTLIYEARSPGNHRVSWDGRDESGAAVGSGVYFVRIEAGTESATHKVVLIK